MLVIHGIHHFKRKPLAFRNDYCLRCGQPRRAVQIRSLDFWHIFWVPIVPLGVRKRWTCTTCGHQPHVATKTRRPFKWVGFVILLILSVPFWLMPVDPTFVFGTWLFRIGAPIGAILTLIHLLRTSKDVSLKDRLGAIQPAADTSCPFCGTPLLTVSSKCTCPNCGVVRC